MSLNSKIDQHIGTFNIQLHSTNYAMNAPFTRSMRLSNDIKMYMFNFTSFDSFCNYIRYKILFTNSLFCTIYYYFIFNFTFYFISCFLNSS